MKLTLKYSDGTVETWVPKAAPPEPPQPQPAGLFGRIRHDHEIWHFPTAAELAALGYPDTGKAGQGMSRPEHIEWERLLESGIWTPIPAGGLPETVKAKDSRFMPLTEAWQRFWFSLLKTAAPGQTDAWLKSRWAGLTRGDRAFTNAHGWDDGYCDFINGTNPGAEPMKQETIITGGNYVKILDDGAQANVNGIPCYRVECLDGTKAPPAITRASHPWLIFIATNSTRSPVNVVERAVGPFPQLDGLSVPVPFMGPGPSAYIAAERVEILPAGATVPGVYNP